MLYSLQSMRAIAAIAVVFMHQLFYYGKTQTHIILPQNPFIEFFYLKSFGSIGVHIFFIISGFVMAMSQDGKCGFSAFKVFIIHRIIRIVPLYWLFLTLMMAIRKSEDKTELFFQSLFFIPVKGTFPLIGAGWSLNYEIFFYILFGILVVWAGLNASVVGLPLLALIVASIYLDSIPIDFWGNYIVVEFILGILAYLLHKKEIIQNYGLWLISVGSTLAISTIFYLNPTSTWAKEAVALWSIPCFLIVLGVTSAEKKGYFEPFFRNRLTTLLGDSSYSLYLSHPFTFFFLNPYVYYHWKLQNTVLPAFLIILLTTFCCIFAILIHKFLEKPLIVGLKQLYSKPKLSNSQ